MNALALIAVLALAQHEHHHQAKPEAPAEPSTDSLYNLKAKWKDARGKTVTLSELSGQPVVVAMIYASCTAVCPLIANDVKRIGAQLPEALRGKVRLVLVSFDPARDTPARLLAYAKERGLEGPGWTLLTGDDDAVRDLAALLGMRYRPTGGGDFAHSNLVTVLDGKGVIVHRREGVGGDIAAAVAAVVSAAARR